MAKDYASLSRSDMRRADRAVKDERWIEAFLLRAPVGTVATVRGDQPFVNTNLFVYDRERRAIYWHTARTGQTRANVAMNPRVCFTAFEMGRLLPADEALEFSVEYASVVVFGDVVVVDDEGEATAALQRLLDKYFPHLEPGHDYRPPVPSELDRTAVYRIDIAEWTAKRKAVEADFPGAIVYQPRIDVPEAD